MDRINNSRPIYSPIDDTGWSEDERLSGRTGGRDFRWAQVNYQSGGNFRGSYSLASEGRRLSTLPQGVQQRSSGSYDSGYGRAFYEIPRREDYSSTSNAYPSPLVNHHPVDDIAFGSYYPPHHAEVPFRYEGESRRASSGSTQSLRDAGFRSGDRRDVQALGSSGRRFVALNAMRFRSYGYEPQETISAAELSSAARSFLSRNAGALHAQRFLPSESNALADLPGYAQDFVMREHRALQRMGFTPLNMMAMAFRSPMEKAYVLVRGESLYGRGYTPREIMDEARLARARPEPGFTLPGMGPVAAAPWNSYQSPFRAGAGLDRTSTLPAMRRSPSPLQNTRGEAFGRPLSPYRTETHPAERTARSGLPTHDWQMPPRRATTGSYSPLAQGGATYDRAWSSSPAQSSADNALSEAEIDSFTGMGIEPEALVALAHRPAIERAFVLSQGEHLMDAGLSIDEIIELARETNSISSPPVASPPRQASPVARPGPRTSEEDLAQLYSYLTDEELTANLQGLNLRNSPAVASTAVPSQPRNDAPFGQKERDTLSHAYLRWSGSHVGADEGEAFYRRTVSQALSQGMASHDGQPNLLLLLSGQAYSEDNRSSRTSAKHEARVKAVTDYLANANDPELLQECDSAAERAVANCADMVIYGLTQVEQAVQQHKIDHNLLTPRQMFRSIESSFLQFRTEGLAAELANRRHSAQSRIATNQNGASESVEFYLALSEKLLANGWNLTESAQSNSYGGIYRITPEELQFVESELNRHVRAMSDDYLQEFEGKPAVEQALRQLFGEDYVRMSEDREAISDQANDALFDNDLPEGTQSSARAVLESLAGVEKDWYRDKLKVVLRNTDMLSQLEAAV